MAAVIGIDLGGTRIKALAWDTEAHQLRDRVLLETQDGEFNGDTPAFANAIKAQIGTWEQKYGRADAVGICAPGLVRDGKTIYHMPARMHGIEHFNWETFLKKPVSMQNDAKAALLGEAWLGNASEVSDAILLTLGTGVGGAIMLDGKILNGKNGKAGCLGHISLDINGVSGLGGLPGTLEELIGNKSVIQRTEQHYDTTQALVEAAQKGEPEAAKAWDTSLRALANALASYINILDIELILIGGGIAEADKALFEPLEVLLRTVEWQPEGKGVPIQPTKLGDWSGAYGAARAAMLLCE